MLTGRLMLSIHRSDMIMVKQRPQLHKSLQPLLDMSRVTSDALPHSLNATTVRVERQGTPDFMDSVVLEVLSSPDEPNESNREIQVLIEAELTDTNPSNSKPIAHNNKNVRPLSAPTKALASSVGVPAHKSNTLPNKRSSLFKVAKERQTVQKEKRTANIHSNAQILLKYAQNRQSSHSNSSLQRGGQSPMQLDKLFESTNGQQKVAGGSVSPELLHSHHSSSSTTIDECSSSSTPLNLRHISMDETRLASVIQMDNIWRQVESGDDSPSLVGQHSSTSHFNEEHFNEEEDGLLLTTASGKTELLQDSIQVDSSLSHPQPSSSQLATTSTPITTLTTPTSPISTPLTISMSLITASPLVTSTPLTTSTPIASAIPLAAAIPLETSTPLTGGLSPPTKSAPLLDDISVTVPKSRDDKQRSASFNNKGIFVYTCRRCCVHMHEHNYYIMC